MQEVTMSINAKLNFRSGENTGKIIPIEKEVIIIGRENNCDFVIDDVEVSRRHAKIAFDDGKYFLYDLKSTNGTVVNGRRIHKSEILRNGDIITIGEKHIIEFIIETLEDALDVSTKDDSSDISKPEYVEVDEIAETRIPEQEIPDQKTPVIQKESFVDRVKHLPGWALILLAILVFLVLFCILPLLVIEITNQWCNLFSSFFNAINPGVCP
jgi:pSer/pThr/pTyr-binding forkhead associated (FHA) protein